MAFTLQSIISGDLNYSAKTESNRASIEAAINELFAIASAAGGDGAQLILDICDRDGVMGSASYALDKAAYLGGSQITIGHRPAFNAAQGDQDVSIAFGTFGGVRQRVTLTGDVTLDAAPITDALPKTIYIAIPSDGTPQFYEDADLPNLVYLYSMTWDGFQLTDFVQTGHVLGGFSLLQEFAKSIKTERIFDGRTDWLSHAESKSTIVLGGDGVMNEIGLNLSRKVIGGFIAVSDDDEGFFSPVGTDADVTLELWDDQDRRWNLEPIVIDCSATPTRLFFKIDPALGNDIYVTEVAEFRLVKVSVGGNVISARDFSWGLYTQDVIGVAIPKDSTKVDGI